MPNISNATVIGSGYITYKNARPQLLSNGWIVAALYSATASRLQFRVKKTPNGAWEDLAFTATSGVLSWSLAIKGTRVFTTLHSSPSASSFLINFDATTVSNSASISASVIDSTSNVGAFSGEDLVINEAGTELHHAFSAKTSTYPNSFNIRYAKGTINGDGSVTWGAVEQVTTANSTSINHTVPSVVINALGEPLIVWEHNDNTSSLRIINKSRRVNGTWTAVTNSSGVFFGSTTPQKNPVAIFVPQTINALVNGRLWVAWHFGASKFNIRISYSDDNGVTWTTPTDLTSGSLYDRLNVSLAADKTGKVFALYEEHQWSPDLDIYMRTFSGGSWGAPVAVAEVDPAAESNPSALVDYSLQMTTPPFVFMSGTDGVKFSGNFNVGASVSPASGALGNKETATLTTYTVTPEAGSTVTQIVEKVNGVTINTFNNPASLSRTLTVPQATWDTLAYFATHTASIAVTDSNGAQTVTTYNFDKRLATGASLLEATKANTDAKNRMRSQLDAISTRVGVANGSSTNQIISAIDARNVVKRQNGTAVVSGGQIVVNTLGFLPKTITIRSSATQNGTYSELLGTNESRNGTTITQNAFTNITATGFTALIAGTNVTWEAQG